MRTTGLFVLGFALTAIGISAVVLGLWGSSDSSTGVVVFIGPIPIAFGSGSNSGTLVLIALVASIGMILAAYLPFLLRRRRAEEEEAR